MNILFLCHRIPYPPNKGEKIRAYNILRYLCERHGVHLAFLIDDRSDLEHVSSLEPLVKSMNYDVIKPKIKKLKSGFSLFGKNALSVSYFYSNSLQKKIDNLIKQENIDCIFCYSSQTAEYVFRSKHSSIPASQRPRLIMDFVDMDSYKWKQYSETALIPMKWVYHHEAEALLNYEKKIARMFHHSVFVSESEKKLFLSRVTAPNISAISNGVDHAFFHPGHKSPIEKKGPTLVFTGMMDYLPNVDGITWFANDIFSNLQKSYPNLTLYIVGNRPSIEVKRLSQKKGIVVTGFVEDVRDYLAIADVCIVPLRIARGIQNKVLEAMAMGKPLVATSGAVAGITAENGRHFLVADTADSISAAVARLLQDETSRHQMGQTSRDFITHHYDWNKKLTCLESLIN